MTSTTHRRVRTTRLVEIPAYGGPGSLRLATRTVADPAPGEALVRVLASSATLSDSIVRRGHNPYTGGLPLPLVLGYDLVGVVEELPAPHPGLRVGDLVADVTRWGANADLVIRPAAALTRVDGDVDPVRLEPLVMTGITAYQSVHRVAGVTAGQTVLVHGATGGVGLLAAELAALAGARVLATGSPGKHRALRDRGAVPLDGRAPDLPARIRALAPDGLDAVLDGVGGAGRAELGALLRPGGVLVGTGFAGPAAGATAVTPETAGRTAAVLAEGAAIMARIAAGGRRAVDYEVGTARETDRPGYDEDLRALAGMLAAGTLRPLTRAYELGDAARAHAEIDAGAVTGRLVLAHSGASR